MPESQSSPAPVSRDHIEIALRIFLTGQEPGYEIIMVHPDGTNNQEIQLSMSGSDNIQGFMLQLAIIVTKENHVFFENEVIPDKDRIIDTFYSYSTRLTESAEHPDWFTLTLDLEPDLFTALMSDPTLGLI